MNESPDEPNYTTIGELILVFDENGQYYTPSILINGKFWEFSEDTRKRMFNAWHSALNIIEEEDPDPNKQESAEVIPLFPK